MSPSLNNNNNNNNNNNKNNHYSRGRISLDFSKSIQSAAGLKTLKPAANGSYLCNQITTNTNSIIPKSTYLILVVALKVELHV